MKTATSSSSKPGPGLQLFALELKYFRDDAAEIVLPRLYGVSERRATPSGSQLWDESRFLAPAQERLLAD